MQQRSICESAVKVVEIPASCAHRYPKLTSHNIWSVSILAPFTVIHFSLVSSKPTLVPRMAIYFTAISRMIGASSQRLFMSLFGYNSTAPSLSGLPN